MPYRGFPYFVKEHTGRAPNNPPDAPTPPSLKSCAVRFFTEPRKCSQVTSCPATNSTRPATPATNRRPFTHIEAKRVVGALVVIALFALACAYVGTVAARAAIAFVDNEVVASSPYGQDNETRADSLSDAQSTWEAGTTPVLFQDDPAWADRPYGSGTIESSGSAPLCLFMIYVNVIGDTTTSPVDIASYSQSSGYADSADATALLTEGVADLGLSAAPVEATESSMRQALVGGRPIIAQVSSRAFGSPKNPAYIVISDIDERGLLIINDPRSKERSSRHWEFDEICSCAQSMWCYSAL